MEQIISYIKPELIIVAAALYFVGMGLKKAEVVKDKYIPAILGTIGIILCLLWVFSTCTCTSGQEVFAALFTAIVQGILVAGASTYVNQLIKQAGKPE